MNNVDDLLLGEKTNQHPETPEHAYLEELDNDDGIDSDQENEEPEENGEETDSNYEEDSDDNPEPEKEEESGEDEYGNKVAQESEVIRDRLKRQAESMERKHRAEIEALRQEMSRNATKQNPEKGVELDPESTEAWNTKLEQFVKQTVSKMTEEQTYATQQANEQRIQQEFQSKFRADMSSFDDFEQVVGGQPISDPMTHALRAMSKPAAFIYAAAKQQASELQRISSIQDPIAQITEMGRLEERMRRTGKAITQAPRPINRTKEDGSATKSTKQKEDSHKDILAASDAGRLQQSRNNRR